MSSFEEPWQDHFGSKDTQRVAGQFGMWVFLATEVLLFAILFVAYAVYRVDYPDAFRKGVSDEKAIYGLVMSLLLVTSSLLAAMAVWDVRKGRSARAGLWLFGAALLACGFLALHGVEYAEHLAKGRGPGEWYADTGDVSPGANLFYSLFWIMTGLHVLHVTVGATVLSVLGVQSLGGKFDADYHVPMLNGVMYWQLVDTIWMFLYPLFYLAR
jgi:cytochrome c oxidase subunit 3